MDFPKEIEGMPEFEGRIDPLLDGQGLSDQTRVIVRLFNKQEQAMEWLGRKVIVAHNLAVQTAKSAVEFQKQTELQRARDRLEAMEARAATRLAKIKLYRRVGAWVAALAVTTIVAELARRFGRS